MLVALAKTGVVWRDISSLVWRRDEKIRSWGSFRVPASFIYAIASAVVKDYRDTLLPAPPIRLFLAECSDYFSGCA